MSKGARWCESLIKINEIQKAIKQNPKNDEDNFLRSASLSRFRPRRRRRRHEVVKHFTSNRIASRNLFTSKCVPPR